MTDNFRNYAAPKPSTKNGKRHRIYLRFAYNVWRRQILQLLNGVTGLGRTRVIGEIGCGPGILLRLLGEWFPDVIVFGLDYDFLLASNARVEAEGAALLQGSAEKLSFASDSMDVLISLHMVEHITSPDRFFADAARVLVDGGGLIIATPNPSGVSARILGKAWSGWRNDHISLHSPRWWRERIDENGFEIIRDGTTGMSGFSWFKRFPLVIFNRGLLFLFGFFPWIYGESYVCIARKCSH